MNKKKTERELQKAPKKARKENNEEFYKNIELLI